MEILKPSFNILTPINRETILNIIELAGRTCYKSEDKITPDSAGKFVRMIVDRGHHSVVEHQAVTVRFTYDIAVGREKTRHRICNFSQESTRYVNYLKKGMQVIDLRPHFKRVESVEVWINAMKHAEMAYNKLIELGEPPEIARGVLPLSLKTELVVTANLRQWRLMFTQRTSRRAHPQMREVMIPLLHEFQKSLPEIYGDIKI